MKPLIKKPIFYLVILFFVVLILFTFNNIEANQSADQAYSWIHGHLYYVSKNVILNDSVVSSGHRYWTLGPFTSVLLLPFVFFMQFYSYKHAQQFLSFVLVTIIFFIAYKLARKKRFSIEDALFLALTFCFGSVFSQVALNPSAWYLAHTVAVFTVMLGLNEYYGKRRYLLIGIYLAFALATRATAAISIIFFFILILKEHSVLTDKIKKFSLLIIPLIYIFTLLMFYNHIRFNNYYDNGYKSLAERMYFPMIEKYYGYSVKHELFTITNIPRNFKVYFLNIWKEAPLGYDMSAFIICLPFLFIIFANYKDNETFAASVACVIILILILSYYWPGWNQLGPRYLNDLLPMLYLILLDSFKKKKLPFEFKYISVATAITNVLIISSAYIHILFYKYF